MTTQNTTRIEIRDHATETMSPFGWNWPDEARLTDFVEQDDRAEWNIRAEKAEQTDRTLENNTEYVALYFIS